MEFDDFILIMIPQFVEVIAAEDVAEEMRSLRLSGLIQLRRTLCRYKGQGYHSKLLCGIAGKKGKMIMEAATKRELQKLMNPKAPHFDGEKFIDNPYLTPEEELICWSKAMELVPLNEHAGKRCQKLFCQVFPEYADAVLESGVS